MYKILFIPLLFTITLLYADDNYTDELKSIYKQQYEIRNSNTYINSKIERFLKLDAINNTNFYQRHVIRLTEKLAKNNNLLERLENKIDYINQVSGPALISMDVNEKYSQELKYIYKQQFKLKNSNSYLRDRIDKKLKFDALNNTNARQRQIIRLIDKIVDNNHQLEEYENRLEYISQLIWLENSKPSYISQK